MFDPTNFLEDIARLKIEFLVYGTILATFIKLIVQYRDFFKR